MVNICKTTVYSHPQLFMQPEFFMERGIRKHCSCIILWMKAVFIDHKSTHSILHNLCNVFTYTYTCILFCFTEKLLEKSEWSIMHPLYLFHFLFYFLINVSDHGKKLLRDSGVLKMISKELWMIQLIPNWHKVSKIYIAIYI